MEEYIKALAKLGADKDQILIVSEEKLKEMEGKIELLMEGGIKYKQYKSIEKTNYIFLSLFSLGYTIHFTTSEKFLTLLKKQSGEQKTKIDQALLKEILRVNIANSCYMDGISSLENAKILETPLQLYKRISEGVDYYINEFYSK